MSQHTTNRPTAEQLVEFVDQAPELGPNALFDTFTRVDHDLSLVDGLRHEVMVYGFEGSRLKAPDLLPPSIKTFLQKDYQVISGIEITSPASEDQFSNLKIMLASGTSFTIEPTSKTHIGSELTSTFEDRLHQKRAHDPLRTEDVAKFIFSLTLPDETKRRIAAPGTRKLMPFKPALHDPLWPLTVQSLARYADYTREARQFDFVVPEFETDTNVTAKLISWIRPNNRRYEFTGNIAREFDTSMQHTFMNIVLSAEMDPETNVYSVSSEDVDIIAMTLNKGADNIAAQCEAAAVIEWTIAFLNHVSPEQTITIAKDFVGDEEEEQQFYD